MPRRLLAALAIILTTAGAAHAQMTGGVDDGIGGGMGGGYSGGGGGMGGGYPGGGHRGQDSGPPPDTADDPPPEEAPRVPQLALNKIEIVGVVKAIDPAGGRITIAYEPVDALNWPAGSNSFPVSKASLLNGASVGEKIRFKIASQEITDLAPYTAKSGS